VLGGLIIEELCWPLMLLFVTFERTLEMDSDEEVEGNLLDRGLGR
jgi:hypothetical protein